MRHARAIGILAQVLTEEACGEVAAEDRRKAVDHAVGCSRCLGLLLAAQARGGEPVRNPENPRETPGCRRITGVLEGLEEPSVRALASQAPDAARHLLACRACAERYAEIESLSVSLGRSGEAGLADDEGPSAEVWFVRWVHRLPVSPLAAMALSAGVLGVANFALLAADWSPGRHELDSRLCLFLALSLPWVAFGVPLMAHEHERARRSAPVFVRDRYGSAFPAAGQLRRSPLMLLTGLGVALELVLAWFVGNRLGRLVELGWRDTLNVVLLVENTLLWVIAAPGIFMALRNATVLARMVVDMELGSFDRKAQARALRLATRGSSFLLGWPLVLMVLVGWDAPPVVLTSAFAGSLAVVVLVLGLPLALRARLVLRAQWTGLPERQKPPAGTSKGNSGSPPEDGELRLSPWLIPPSRVALWVLGGALSGLAGYSLSWMGSVLARGPAAPPGLG